MPSADKTTHTRRRRMASTIPLLCLITLLHTRTAAQDTTSAQLPADSLFKNTATTQPLPSDSLAQRLKRQKRNRALVVTGSTALAAGALYTYLQKTWWAEGSTSFHFDQGRDWRYSNNLDKMGHFMGGMMAADLYYDVFRWMDMPDRKAAWWGFGMGTAMHLAIEVKDGYAKDWGFSIPDIVAGSVGSLMPVLRLKSEFFRHTDFKFSYWRRSDKYFQATGKEPKFNIDDYINQTYWMTVNLKYLTGKKVEWMPDWLGISLGWGIEAESWNTNPADPGTGGRPEFYLSPDIDLVRLFKPKKPFWKFTLQRLNYLKFPMPTLQFAQKVKVWPVFW